MAKKIEAHKQNKFTWLAIVTIVLTLGFTYTFGRDAIYNQLNDWMLIPRPERLTELYFVNSSNLPTEYIVGQEQIIQFTIHNLEYRTTSYNYILTQISEDGKISAPLASGSLKLSQDQTQTITKPVVLSNLGNQSKIEIKIDFEGIAFGQNNPSLQSQSIFYLVNKEMVEL